MNLNSKKLTIGGLAVIYLGTLIFVQVNEVARSRREAGLSAAIVSVPVSSRGCVECHEAVEHDVDAFEHWGELIATVVPPLDCAKCHPTEAAEFAASHHSKGGNILASLDNFLAETVEGARFSFDPHGDTPGLMVTSVDGLSSAVSGCMQCHGSKLALESIDGGKITVDDLLPDADGVPTNAVAVADILRDEDGQVVYHANTWPNTGIGRINLDGSLGSCSACHSRHDFSPLRARQPENCAKCHLGPDHPQKEIYEESKHGVAFRDLKDEMNLDADRWVRTTHRPRPARPATCPAIRATTAT